MSKYTYSSAEVLPEDRGSGEENVLTLNPAGKLLKPAPSGIFSLRRARYFNKARFDETGQGVRRSDLAEAAIAEVTGEYQQAGDVRNQRAQIPRR
jgi:hypothetical protein